MPGRPGQRDRLHQRQCRGHPIGPKHIECRIDGAVSADDESDGDQRLRQVDAESELRCRDLAAGWVQQPDVPVVTDQDGPAGKPPVRDLVQMQALQLPPQVVEQAVADLVGLEVGERPPWNMVEHEHDRVVADVESLP